MQACASFDGYATCMKQKLPSRNAQRQMDVCYRAQRVELLCSAFSCCHALTQYSDHRLWRRVEPDAAADGGHE